MKIEAYGLPTGGWPILILDNRKVVVGTAVWVKESDAWGDTWVRVR